MRITPLELYEMELEAYPEKLANYEQAAKLFPELISLGWVKRPEPPQYPQPVSYIPGYMRSRKWKRQQRG